jgi:hypothetical protein
MVATSGIAGALLSCKATPAAIAETATATATPTTPPAAAMPTAIPWPYSKVDPTKAAERAFTAYSNGGCMYGAFEGIIGELRDTVGAPYNAFPTTMMKYGGAGVNGWGTLCGALNGIAAAIYLVADSKACSPLINEVFGWYGVTALPDYKPTTSKIATCATSIADSQLCHQSVTKWCDASGFKTTSAERADRCGRLTASVVYKTVTLLNAQADGTFKATFAVPASVTGCLSCHGKGGALENVHITNQTDCRECHDTFPASHPVQ